MALAMQPILFNLSYQEAETYGLVLAAENIQASTVRTGRNWALMVREQDREAAIEAVGRYREENSSLPEPFPEPIPVPARRTTSGLWAACLLLLFHFTAVRSGRYPDLVERGAATASDIVGGELWRTVTALTLHADGAHLVANMAAIALFGTLVCHFAGYGGGWLLVLVSGALGNLLNSMFHYAGNSPHSSIGASTAVFGAIGLLGGYRLIQRVRMGMRQGVGRWRAMAPLGAALALLAMLMGGDERGELAQRVDVGAHAFGWLAGTLLGALYALLPGMAGMSSMAEPDVAAEPPLLQPALLGVALGVLAMAWAMALRA